MRNSRLRSLVLATVAAVPLLEASPAAARIASCIVDGGGNPYERECGMDTALAGIRGAYGSTPHDLSILSGSGGAAPDCAGRVGCTGGAGCSSRGLLENASCGMSIPLVCTNSDLVIPRQLSIRTPPGRLRPATMDSFHENCFFNSLSPPRTPIDVCHYWGINHGEPAGQSLFTNRLSRGAHAGTAPVLTPAHLASKAEHCRTFRFVTNSCFSGQMGRMIYDSDGRVIPGRCGIAPGPPGTVTNGNLTANTAGETLNITALTEDGAPVPVQVTGLPMSVRYSHLDNFTEAMQSAPTGSIDDFYESEAGAVINEPSISRDPPFLTSDYFLNDIFRGNEIDPDTKSLMDFEPSRVELHTRLTASNAAGDILGCFIGTGVDTGVARLLESMATVADVSDGGPLTPAEKSAVERDARTHARRLNAIRTVYAGRCAERNADYEAAPSSPEGLRLHVTREAVDEVHRLQFGFIRTCDFRNDYQTYVTERNRLLAARETARTRVAQAREELRREIRRNCYVGGYPLEGPIFRTCTGNAERTWNPRIAAAERAMAEAQTQGETFLQRTSDFRLYESVELRMAQVIQLARTGSAQRIRDFLHVRRCETTPFNDPVPGT